jgi:hypothetical protein
VVEEVQRLKQNLARVACAKATLARLDGTSANRKLMSLKHLWCILGLVGFGVAGNPAAAAAPATKPSFEGIEYFEKHIRPVLVERCYRCHSQDAEKVRGGLLLDSREGLMKGGDNGPVIVTGDPEKSRLIIAIRYHDEEIRMPPKDPLAEQQIAHFVEWVKMGAPDPRTAESLAKAAAPAYDYAKAKEFWAFQPVRAAKIPPVRDDHYAINDVDRFVLAKLESKGLKPVASADRVTLIRRATFDLTGLPPTPDEVAAFLSDSSADAWEKVIDRLLASAHYGERWGRHWLDLVRYADTSGCNSDYPVPSAYKYRDYVIKSFNQDKRYDQFLKEQLAGDLLPQRMADKNAGPTDKWDNIIATGYLAEARRFGSRNAEFHLTIEDTIDNVGKTMLGLSVSCARCHDHKFDPIPTSDYYGLYGIFRSTKYAFPGTEIYKHTRDFVPLVDGEEAKALRKHEQEQTEIDDKIERLVQERMPLLVREKQRELKEACSVFPVEKRSRICRRDDAGLPAPGERTLVQVKAEMADLREKQLRLDFTPMVVEKAYAASEGTPADAKIQRKGDPQNLGETVRRGFLTILGGQKLSADCKGSGRLELANWIADAKNPLTARVMVNRIWQYHFGKGIVQTPNDFGARGKAPTHPELLDWLACRFVEHGWSIKSMHKLIMMSRTYQLACDDEPTNSAVDYDNDYLWRFNRRRLSAEEIRDAMLFVAGALDESPGGPHPFPPENEWRYTQHKPFVANYDSHRRGIYLMQQRIKKQPFLEVFDGADTNATTAIRPLSTTPIQALFVMNDPFAHEMAEKFAVRVGMAVADEDRRIEYAYKLAFGRMPTSEERQLGHEYLKNCREKMKEAGLPWDQQNKAAMASYSRMILGSNEFFFLE